ncbi:hypothetical protein ACTU44_11965 [Thalassospira sp. SM2505]
MHIPSEGSVLDHYINRATESIRSQKYDGKASIARVWFARHLYLHNEPEFYDELIAALIARGILVVNGKRLMIGQLPLPTKITRVTVGEVVDHEYAQKSDAEKAAIERAGALASQANRAREARNARRAKMMMRRIR